MSTEPPTIDPIAVLLVFAGGLAGGMHRVVDRVLASMTEAERRFVRSLVLDADRGSFSDAIQNQYQIGQIANVQSGGPDDLSLIQAVVRRDDGRRSADSLLSRMNGARGDRVIGHKVFADDLATCETALLALGRELKHLDAMRPSEIHVRVCGSLAGAIGSNFVVLGGELVHEAAKRAGIKAGIRVIVHCLSPNLVMSDIRPQYLDENTVATLRDVSAVASGHPITFLFHDVDPKPADEVLLEDIRYRSSALHSNTGSEEAQRAIPASLEGILGTAIHMSCSPAGAIIRSNFVNSANADSEHVFQIIQGEGVMVPRRDYADNYTARTVADFTDRVARTTPSGEPVISSRISDVFNREVAAGIDGAKALFQEVHQSYLVAGSDPDARLVTDGSWQRVVEILGAKADRTVFPIEEAIPLLWQSYLTIDRRDVAQFAEDLANHHEGSLADAQDTFGSARRSVIAAVSDYQKGLFQRVMNGSGEFANECNRAALLATLLSTFEAHLDRVLASWREAFGAISTVPDGNGGLIDKRKLLTEQIDGELAQLSQSLIARIVPLTGWGTLRYVRRLAAERLDIEFLDIAIKLLEEMATAIRKELRLAGGWSSSASSILAGIAGTASLRRADAEASLAAAKSYGSAILVGEERLKAALAVILRNESDRLIQDSEWTIVEGRAVGRVKTIELEPTRRGASTPDEKNYELSSRNAFAACLQAADQIDVTSCVAEEFDTPERLLDTLRRSVDPDAEVELEGLKSNAQPARSTVLALPREVAFDAVPFFDELKRAVREEEKCIVTDTRSLRYTKALAHVPLQRLRLVGRAGRAYVTSDRVLHVNDMMERSRRVSRELHRARGITWIPPIAVATLLDDPASLRKVVIAMATGLVKGAEIKTKNGPASVWATTARKPSTSNPSVSVTGFDLVAQLGRDPLRGDIDKVVDRFDSLPVPRRLEALTRAHAALLTDPPACVGDEKDLLRLIDIVLMAEVTRLQRTAAYEKVTP